MIMGDNDRRPHVLFVSYLFTPSEQIAVRRAAAFRDAFEELGIRTTVLTSAISGSADGDGARVVRSGDLRTRFETQYQALVGFKDAPVAERNAQRWWSRAIVPDVTAVSWGGSALVNLLRLVRRDRPDAVFTTSPPESAHLLGLAAHRLGIPWVADFRDGWMFEPPAPRSRLARLDSALERLVATRADVVTAVNEPIAEDLRRRYGVPAVHLTNGFDPRRAAAVTDERRLLDPDRFSLVYTGTLALDAKQRALQDRGGAAALFLAALERLLGERPALRGELELVFAGTFSQAERELVTRGELADVVRVVGRLPSARALGLQRAADGLLLLTGRRDANTGKVYEYLAARKPIFVLAPSGSAAAALLRRAGPHTVIEPAEVDEVARGLAEYVDTWSARPDGFRLAPGFDLEEFDFRRIAGQLLNLLQARLGEAGQVG